MRPETLEQNKDEKDGRKEVEVRRKRGGRRRMDIHTIEGAVSGRGRVKEAWWWTCGESIAWDEHKDSYLHTHTQLVLVEMVW